jgi:putative nucleotidyltransferase with HDIG domain
MKAAIMAPKVSALIKSFLFSRKKAAWIGAFLICFVVIFLNMNSSRDFGRNFMDFEAGKVADRDVIAERAVVYQDEHATALRIEAQERLVSAVFRYSYETTERLRNRWNNFTSLAENLFTEASSRQTFTLALQAEFPGEFPDEVLNLLYQQDDDFEAILRDGAVILGAILERGIYSIPSVGLEHLNPDVVELIRQSGTRIEQERISLESVITKDNTITAVESHILAGSYSSLFVRLVPELLLPFLKENVFYSSEDTLRRVAEVSSAVEPVTRSIEQGKRVIRKGFVITEDEMAELNALMMTLPRNEVHMIFAYLLFLLMLFGLLMFLSGSRIVGRSLTDSETYLIAGLSTLYIAGSVLLRNISVEPMPASVIAPTALVVMLPTILVHPRLAFMLAMALPLGAFITGSFDTASYIFALVSGIVAAYSLHGAEKRMDLVKAGLIIAAANLAAMTAVLLWQNSPGEIYVGSLFWAAFNGIASGMLVLGVLSPLEHALNASTTFRLIELSDLNAPILRRLSTVAPGTFSHSILVANLAETACQEIGANSLLARVGAYYHDIGKIENPGYFVENQTDHNPHDEMAPRLSATVIRSHVKLGVEKARQLGLPREVIDIIGEHHGNSVITYFYNKALNQEDGKKSPVNIEDFCYPGNPPRSKESAVVMLADVAEAAVRSMNKPTISKMEKFIQELIENKEEHGQLSHSELSFKDLEIIKNAFYRVLAAYYHSRIEYPKIGHDQADEKETPALITEGANNGSISAGGAGVK